MTNILIVAPHALDEVLGCGGTLLQRTAAGDAVRTVVVFGDGLGHDAKRRTACKIVAEEAECLPPTFCSFPENRGDVTPLVEIVSAIETAVRETNPSVVYVPHGGSLHIDHETTYRAAMTAMRPVPGVGVRQIYGYEIVSSTEWRPAVDGMAFCPARFVDIENQLSRKMEILRHYEFDMRDEPHARSYAAVRRLAEVRGATVGRRSAEAFTVIWDVVADDDAHPQCRPLID